MRRSASTVVRWRKLPIPGAAVTPTLKVLPESGPNSANRVVSWTIRSETGSCQPLLMKQGRPWMAFCWQISSSTLWSPYCSATLTIPTPGLEPAEGVERVLGEGLAPGEALGRDREVAGVVAVVLGVLRVVRVEEVGLVEDVESPVQAARQVGVAPVVDPVRGHGEDGRGEELVPEHVGERDRGPAVEVAARGHPHVERRPALEVEPLEEPLAALVLRHHLVRHVGLEVDEALGGRLDLLLDLLHGLRGVLGVQQVLALVVGDEGEPVAPRRLERGGGQGAAEHVGVLGDRPRLQVEAAQVGDVVVLVGGVVDLLPVRREGGRRVVEGAEGELGLARRVAEREGVDLRVAADAPLVDDQLAVRGDLRVVVRVLVPGEVRDRPRLEVEGPDVGDALLERGEEDASGRRRGGTGPGSRRAAPGPSSAPCRRSRRPGRSSAPSRCDRRSRRGPRGGRR